MAEPRRSANDRQELVTIIRQVRSRWRNKLMVRGALVVLGGGLLALIAASLGLQALRFSPTSVVSFRLTVFAVFAGLAFLWFVRPLRQRVTDMQVALYVEEHDPKLQAAILSAVEVGATQAAGPAESSPVVQKLIEQAIDRSRSLEGGKAVGRRAFKRDAVALGLLAGFAFLLLLVGPEFFRQGASALLTLSLSAENASPFSIAVTPGSVSVPKGSAQAITAKLSGFRSNDVALMVKPEGEQKFQRMPLIATGDPEKFEGMLFDVKAPIQYYVESDDVRSPTYAMKVVELPAVGKLELEYVFPSYTGLAPQRVESGGDVAALQGTEVHVKVTPTMSSPGGRLQIEPAATPGLTRQADGTLTGSFTIKEDGFYHVELDTDGGAHVNASPKYTIDMIEDHAPTVTFAKPRRDVSANPVEEVNLQAKADDDFGVKQLTLVYSVNGGEEKTKTLYGNGAKPLTEVVAGHTLYLEELGVKPGDFIAYYATAVDNDSVHPNTTSSDIYFVKVVPFNQNFKEGQSQAGGGGGGGGGGGQQSPGALSEQEKQIISATFNSERDRPKTPVDKFKQDTTFISLAQAKLRDEVDQLIQQMAQRLGNDPNFKNIADALIKASTEMKAAEGLLKSQKTKDAMAPEQRALKALQDSEQAYEIVVRRSQQQGGGGGGGGGGQMAQDLADLFQLQLDRNANQYQLQQNAQQQQQTANQQIDEIAQKLRDLARRQLQQQQQQQQRAAGQRQQSSGGTGSGQRAMADEVEKAARQLEQLQRDLQKQGQQRPDLAEAAKRLQQAADNMKKAAANGSQDAGAQAQQALDELQQAQRLLDQGQQEQKGQDIKAAQQKADALVKQQKDIAKQVSGLDGKTGSDKESAMQQVGQQKDDLKAGVNELSQQLGQLAGQAVANGQRDTARKEQEAQAAIRDTMVGPKIEYSKSAMTSGSEYTKPIESDIQSSLESVQKKIGEAAQASDKSQQGQGLGKALQQTTDLTHAVQSMEQQAIQANGGQPGQQGQGQQGQGQQGQGQQGQGQQGQGQQGQGQQGQQRLGQGQQGQGQQGQGQQGQGQQGQGQQGQGQGQGQQGQGQGQGQQGQGGQGQGRPGQQPGQPGGGSGGGPQQQGGSPQPNTPQGPISPQDTRQFKNQATQLANQAQEIGKLLQQNGAPQTDVKTMNDVSQALTAAGTKAGNTQEFEKFASQALEKLKSFEFDLRKRVNAGNDQMYLSGSEEVPPAFRKSIEDYSKAISKQTGGATTPPPATAKPGRGGGGGS